MGRRFARTLMKIMLSIPKTISRATSVKKAMIVFGSRMNSSILYLF
jgi:hypothetical protein